MLPNPRAGWEQQALAAGLACERLRPGCSALVLSPGLSHTVDEITEVPAHDESESRIKANIWTSLARRGAGGSGAACQLPAQRWFLTECCRGAGRCLRGISSDLCRHPAVGALGQAKKEGPESPRTLSHDSVSPSGEGAHVGTACQGAGWCGEMVHAESAHPPSFLGVIAAAGCVSCSSELRRPRSSSTAPAWAAVGR